MERSMMAPKGPKAPRSSSGLSSAPYTYSVFPFRGGRRSGNESDPVGAHGGLGGAPRRPGPPPDPQGEGPFRGSRELGAPLPTAPQGPGRPPRDPWVVSPPPAPWGAGPPWDLPPAPRDLGHPSPRPLGTLPVSSIAPTILPQHLRVWPPPGPAPPHPPRTAEDPVPLPAPLLRLRLLFPVQASLPPLRGVPPAPPTLWFPQPLAGAHEAVGRGHGGGG